jgi:nicotinate phosphoribosyltransferase
VAAVEEKGGLVPKIKISESLKKVTTPGFKNLYRF